MDGDRVGLLERAPWARRHRLDVHAYDRMAEVGLLEPDARVELIEGEIVDMVPIGVGHGGATTGLTNILAVAAAGRALVTAGGPLRLSDDSEPQPDVMLVRPRADFYRTAHPVPADVLLVIEVSESSLRFDRTVKLPLCARHGIPEYWIANLVEGVVEVYRDPEGEVWRATTRAGRGEVVEPAPFPGLRVAVSDILG